MDCSTCVLGINATETDLNRDFHFAFRFWLVYAKSVFRSRRSAWLRRSARRSTQVKPSRLCAWLRTTVCEHACSSWSDGRVERWRSRSLNSPPSIQTSQPLMPSVTGITGSPRVTVSDFRTPAESSQCLDCSRARTRYERSLMPPVSISCSANLPCPTVIEEPARTGRSPVPKTSGEFWQAHPVPSGRLGSHGRRRPASRRAACFAYQSASHKSAMAITRPCDPSRVYFVCCCRFADDAPPEPGAHGPGSRDRHPTNFIATAVLFWEVFDDASIARTNTLV